MYIVIIELFGHHADPYYKYWLFLFGYPAISPIQRLIFAIKWDYPDHFTLPTNLTSSAPICLDLSRFVSILNPDGSWGLEVKKKMCGNSIDTWLWPSHFLHQDTRIPKRHICRLLRIFRIMAIEEEEMRFIWWHASVGLTIWSDFLTSTIFS